MSAPVAPTQPASNVSASLSKGEAPARVAVITDAYYEELIAGIAAYARLHHWDLDTAMIRCPGTLPKQERWAGVLAMVDRQSTAQWIEETDCPMVELLNDAVASHPSVVCDYAAIGRRGAQHLLELGDVHFGYYCGFVDFPASRCARDSFADEMKSRGFPVVHFDLELPSNYGGRTKSSRAERLAWLTPKLAAAPLPIAIMAEDDRFAVDLFLAARSLGLRIPEDVAILGAENQELVLSPVPVEISSVDCNLREVGWRGAELLNRMMGGATPGSPEVPMITVVPPKDIIVRYSTATFACDHAAVTAAALFVRRHFREPITVKEVAKQAGMSVRMLQAEYPIHVGRSVKEDILRHRMSSAQLLLERTNLKLEAVASEAGLGTAVNLCRMFQQKHGMTPNEWRREHGRPGLAGK